MQLVLLIGLHHLLLLGRIERYERGDSLLRRQSLTPIGILWLTMLPFQRHLEHIVFHKLRKSLYCRQRNRRHYSSPEVARLRYSRFSFRLDVRI